MPPPAFRAAGTLAHSTTTVTPAAPAGLTSNDIEILVVESQAGTHSLSTAAGFAAAGTQIDVPSGTATIATHGSIWWRRWNGTDGDPTVASATNHVLGQRYAFSGCITTGDPWDFIDQSSEGTEDTTGSADSSSSTAGADRLIAIIVGSSKPDTLSTTEISAPTNANLTSLTERADNAGNSGNGGHVGLFTGEKATAGTVGNTTYTKASAAFKWHYVVALKPPAAADASLLPVSGRDPYGTLRRLSPLWKRRGGIWLPDYALPKAVIL